MQPTPTSRRRPDHRTQPAEGVSDGRDSDDNVCVRTWGTPRTFDFEPKAHWELGEALDILDFERAAKLSGSRFAVLKGKGARLSRAIVQFFLDRAGDRGYLEVIPPLLVSRSTMWSTGQLTKFSDAMFMDQDADLFMIPTAEVPLTALHGNEILSDVKVGLPGDVGEEFVGKTDRAFSAGINEISAL